MMKDLNNIKLEIGNYASTQFNLPEEITNQIDNYFKKLIDKEDIANKKDLPNYAQDGIVTNKSHVTVLYGIKEGMEEIIKEVAESKEQVFVILGKTNIFETSFLNYDVLYIEILSLGIRRLRSALQKEVEYVKSPFSFTPHSTVAYLKKGTGKKYKGDNKFEGISLKLHSLTYSSKEGIDKIYHLKY